MIGIDIESKRKPREMGATSLQEAIGAQNDILVPGMSFEYRIQLVEDEAHSTFNHCKVEALIRRAEL